MVNNTGSTTRVKLMARMPKSDDVWNDIFDSLILNTEPPIEYIKNVVITTKTGVRLKVSALDFAQILERERFIHPEESEILSCRLAINFNKVRKDVDEWADDFIYFFDNNGEFKPEPKKPRKPRAVATKTKTSTGTKTRKTTKTPAKAKSTGTAKVTESKTAKKTTTRKPATKKNSK